MIKGGQEIWKYVLEILQAISLLYDQTLFGIAIPAIMILLNFIWMYLMHQLMARFSRRWEFLGY